MQLGTLEHHIAWQLHPVSAYRQIKVLGLDCEIQMCVDATMPSDQHHSRSVIVQDANTY